MSGTGEHDVVAGVGWNGIHRDARNSDTVPFALRRRLRTDSHVLAGRTVLFGPSVGADGRRYVTTGQAAPGPRVHIMSADGESIDAHEADRSRPSPRVCTDVPLFVGSDRFVVSDDRHTWCFYLDGRLLWSTDLVDLGAVGGPVSSIVTQDGFVGGVTMEGQLVLLDPESGAPVRPVFDLGAGAGFAPPPSTPGLWAEDMMDADTVALIEPAFFGFGHPVTCSPAVGPHTGLLYVPAVSASSDASDLIALDVTGPQVQVVTRTSISGRCTSSPSVSADGRLVYTVDGSGLVHAIDAHDGGVVWAVPGGGPAASPAIGPDGHRVQRRHRAGIGAVGDRRRSGSVASKLRRTRAPLPAIAAGCANVPASGSDRHGQQRADSRRRCVAGRRGARLRVPPSRHRRRVPATAPIAACHSRHLGRRSRR